MKGKMVERKKKINRIEQVPEDCLAWQAQARLAEQVPVMEQE